MKVLVTGAAGFIGSHMAERLLSDGHEVVGIDSYTSYYAKSLKEANTASVSAAGGTVLPLDLATDDLSAAVAEVEAVFHLAAQPGISATVPFELYERNNILATHRLLEALDGSSTLKGFINFATSSIYGRHATDDETAAPKPTSYYGVTKLAAEQLVLAKQRESGFPGISIRPFSICGERERPEKLYPRLIKSILEDEEFPLYEGSREHIRTFTYVGDLVDGAMLILEKLPECIGEIFNIGSDTTNTTEEGLEYIQEILGKQAKFKMMPKRPGDQLETAANIEKAKRVLGYQPKVALKEALTREVAWYKAELGKA